MPSPYEIFLRSFGTFTEIQQLSLSAVSSGKNCLITAPTGSGKTEAALIPVLNKIYKSGGEKGIQAVYITPLRALNRDLIKRIEGICKEAGITVSVRHGDTSQKERKKQVESPPALLITTPESMQNIFLSGRLKSALKNVGCVLVDEVHELYYTKRGAQLSIALERLRNISGEFQRIGISATIGESKEVSLFLFGNREHTVVKSPLAKQFEIGIEMPKVPDAGSATFSETFGLDKQSTARIERVAALIRSSAATIVFTNTRQVAESLGSKLLYLNKERDFGGVAVHHSSLDKDERVKVENAFKEAKIKGIVATSSLELGIDVGRVDLVVQYGSPKQAVRLIQRVGRAGHTEKKAAKGKILVAEVMDALESSVIIGNVLDAKLEVHSIERNALDVAVNQICAMTLEHKRIEASKIYETISAAAPYSAMERGTFDRLIKFASELNLIRYSEGFASIGRRGMDYFFSNISVIPDNVRFAVKDVISNKIISSLDEHFVYNYLDEGASFISKGIPWRVVSLEEGVILVEPSSDIEAAVPDWEGEDIPVSHQVAAGVYSVFEKGLASGASSMDDEVLKSSLDFISRQRKHFTPTSQKVFIEELESYAVVYVGLGRLANEFLSRVIGSILLQRHPGCTLRATPYAIVIEFGDLGRKPDMHLVFSLLKEGISHDRVSVIASGSDLFRYKFVQVAKLFGVVEKKVALTKAAATRLMDFYRNSVVFDEALRDLNKNYFDADDVLSFIRDFRQGRISVELVRSPGSPLSNEILRSAYHYKELLMPNLPNERDIATFKSSLQGRTVKLLCTFCGFISEEEVNLNKDVKYFCHSCKSPMLCAYNEGYEEAVLRRIGGKRLGKQDMAAYENAIKEAGLVSAYGNRAVIALETYGVGLSTAVRVLKYMRSDFPRFFADLIEAQKTFARTKRFWKGASSRLN